TPRASRHHAHRDTTRTEAPDLWVYATPRDARASHRSIVATNATMLLSFACSNVRLPCYVVLAMSDPARRRATHQDVLDAPPHQIAEVIHGKLSLSPHPGIAQSHVTGSLAAVLVPPFEHGHSGPGGWSFLLGPELHLGDQIVVPDLAGWRAERMPV